MLTWIEYAIVRVGVQLIELADTRPLTQREENLLDVCLSVTARIEIRESKAPLVKSAKEP